MYSEQDYGGTTDIAELWTVPVSRGFPSNQPQTLAKPRLIQLLLSGMQTPEHRIQRPMLVRPQAPSQCPVGVDNSSTKPRLASRHCFGNTASQPQTPTLQAGMFKFSTLHSLGLYAPSATPSLRCLHFSPSPLPLLCGFI